MDAIDYPPLYTAADEASLGGQRLYTGLVRGDLILTVAAALIAALSPLVPGDFASWHALALAALLLLAVMARTVNRLLRRERDWFDGRAVAESVKTASWKYMMRVEPYNRPEPEAERQFVSDLRDILAERKDLQQDMRHIPADSQQITERMGAVRALPLGERKAIYMAKRVGDQQAWYSRKSVASRAAANFWFWVGLAAQVGALLVALVRVLLPAIPSFVPVLTSVAAAATAWAQLRRHDEIGRSYALAAQELMLARTLLESADDEGALTELVRQSEDAISREHKLWVAKRS